jgi:hypothetical protein
VSLEEDDRVYAADIVPAIFSKADGSPYQIGHTILLSIDDNQVDYQPSIGPYNRTENQALRFVERLGRP